MNAPVKLGNRSLQDAKSTDLRSASIVPFLLHRANLARFRPILLAKLRAAERNMFCELR